MKKALFMGHSYHEKTKSSAFMVQLLSLTYEVTSFYSSPYEDGLDAYHSLQGQKYDIVVCWQLLPPREVIDSCITYDHGVFFPMYDDAPARSKAIWQDYKDFLIICFCRTLHDELLGKNLNSKYVQYFPKPNNPEANSLEANNPELTDAIALGDENSIFFWQRRANVNSNTIYSVLGKNAINTLHIHKSLDPKEVFIEPTKEITWDIRYSEWFPEKNDLTKKMSESAIYFVPRLAEGIGMSFLDAMAMGRCVVASDNPTMNEYIQDGKTGFLYDFKNTGAIQLTDIRIVQKNTMEYMHNGYKKWQTEKNHIVQWIEAYTQNSATLISHKRIPYSFVNLLCQSMYYAFLALFIGGKRGKFYKWKSLFLKKLLKEK